MSKRKYSRWYLNKVKTFKKKFPDFGGFKAVDGGCPVCGKDTLISYIHLKHMDDYPVINGKQNCGHHCLSCDFNGITTRKIQEK